ncbi:MAG: hypothetical protein FWE20_01030 [Defluviitaleaceae bacterium]|nr:hypothetical protein [Defluviitaleaceae bacterium]
MSGDSEKRAVLMHVRKFLGKVKMEYNTQFHVVLYTSFGKLVCDIEPFAQESSALRFTDDPTVFTLDASAIFDGKS